MVVLCGRCGREFETSARLRVNKDWRYDTEEDREELPIKKVCPDCEADADEEPW